MSKKIHMVACHIEEKRYTTIRVDNIPISRNVMETIERLSIFLGRNAIRHNGRLKERVQKRESILLWQHADIHLAREIVDVLAAKFQTIFDHPVEVRWERSVTEREAA